MPVKDSRRPERVVVDISRDDEENLGVDTSRIQFPATAGGQLRTPILDATEYDTPADETDPQIPGDILPRERIILIL